MARIALFASGTASNAQCILEHFGYLQKAPFPGGAVSDPSIRSCEIACTISDRSSSGIHQLSASAGLPGFLVSYRSGREHAEQRIRSVLAEQKVDLLVLAGYMRLLGAELVDTYAGRILNIHPSLLPAFPGMHAIERSFQSGNARAGITIHLVDAGMDTGPVIAQASFDRTTIESIVDFEKRIHRLEHILYPKVVEQVAKYIDNGQWPGANLYASGLRESLPDCYRLEDTHT